MCIRDRRSVGMPEELYYQSPFDLSGGQKRRVAIAGVLAMKPEVLILDEPTAGLDPAGRDEILDLVARMHRERNMTVILVSHSMEDVAKYVAVSYTHLSESNIFVFMHLEKKGAYGL